MILCIKSDTKDVYVGLWEEKKELSAKQWQAGRELSSQLLEVVNDNCNKVAKTTEDISGIVVYEGPGSYTGLRISISVANAIGYSSRIPVIGTSGDKWLEQGLLAIEDMKEFVPISPQYGGEVFTTTPRK